MKAWKAFAAAAAAVAAAPARADLPAPEGYYSAVEPGGTVEIHVMTSSGRGCPDDGLLRRNTVTGEIVAIATCSDDLTFLDQCVPAGEYQYGLARPLACQSSGGTQYYETVTVTDGAAEGCTRTIVAPAPAGSVPWGSEQWVCHGSYGGPHDSSHFFGCGTGGVLGTNLVVLLVGLGLWRWRPGRRRA